MLNLRKNIAKIICIVSALFLFLFCDVSYAGDVKSSNNSGTAIIAIIPQSMTPITVSPTDMQYEIFTVTNDTNRSVSGITD